jgi:hypothetical protein
MTIEEFFMKVNRGMMIGDALLIIALLLLFIAYRVDKYYSGLEKSRRDPLDKKNRVEV